MPSSRMTITPSPSTVGDPITFKHTGPYPVTVTLEWYPTGPKPTSIIITGPNGYTMDCPDADTVTMYDPAAGGAPPVSSVIN